VVWALVGPTGVGKTTTIAKLAARYALKHGLTVGMITVDTFRMAAPEQLKVYGRIMDIPTKVASTPAELRDAVEELSDRLRFTGLVDIDLDRAEAAAASSPVTEGAITSTDSDDIIDAVDAVVLAVPHDLHRDIAVKFLDAGKHVLVEKPLANSERECFDIIEAADRSGCVAMHGYVMRFTPIVREYARLIKERAYGQCFQLSIWTEQYTDRSRGDWVGEAARVGGGQLFSHGCHYIDLILHMLGTPESGTHVGTNLGTPWMELEGTSNVAMKFASGATAYHFGTWGARGTKLRYSMHAHCTRGMLELDYRNGEIVLWLDPSHGDLGGMSREELADPDNAPQSKLLYRVEPGAKHTSAEMTHFLDCIESGGTPETDLRSGVQSLRAIWRMYEAERRGVVADLRGLALDAFSPEPDPFLAETKQFGYTCSIQELDL